MFPQLKSAIYLDNAGAPPPPTYVLEKTFDLLKHQLLGNPHSLGPSSFETQTQINEIRHLILKYLNTDQHSVVFTQNATHAIQLVQHFGFNQVYVHEFSHTSLLGLGGTVVSHVDQLPAQSGLFCYPAQCNFSGTRLPLDWIKRAQDKGHSVLLDTASYAMTSPMDLHKYPVDFMILSFYKLFGYPSGLGCLIVKNNLKLKSSYLGGGTVDAIAIEPLYLVHKPSTSARLETGTLPFQEIVSLRFGFEYIESLGGWYQLRTQTMDLFESCFQLMSGLKYPNGQPLCKLYVQDYQREMQGPILAFNLLQSDTNFIGYYTVMRLASVCQFHIRSGCFCNPGACQKHLGLSSIQIQENHQKHGHVCGDSIDLIDGKPTGALRLSFGYCNTPQDVDKWIAFLEEYFIQKHEYRHQPSEAQLQIEHLVVYPIKSCRGVKVEQSIVTRSGLQFDRQWKIVDVHERPMTLRKYPQLNQLQICLSDGIVSLKTPDQTSFATLLQKMDNTTETGDTHQSEGAQSVMCSFLKQSCTFEHSSGSFSNTSPLLLVSQDSINALNEHCPEQVSWHVFRPNVVISGLDPFVEETWKGKTLLLDDQAFYVTDLCERCDMINIRLDGTRSREPLLTLAKMRKQSGKIPFGVLLEHLPEHSKAPYVLKTGFIHEIQWV
ncbi:pyridoxal phosphate-dependent transferase [Gorgonomyces haynaldii]|nr:pyridoxal phosphate-dependent transferase [Gorgonomyces haynaldii]